MALAVEYQDIRYTVYQDIRYTLQLLAVEEPVGLSRWKSRLR
jgi:hypothetical protein